MAMMIIDLLIALSLLGSHVRSDQVNTTVTIPPSSALQDYLCSGPLQSNMTVVLEDGEHIISSESSCNIVNKGSVTITGSLVSTKRTIVRCESKTSAVFAFVSVQILTMERITFINCGLQLESIEFTLIVNCTFQDSTSGAISSNTNVHSDTLVMLNGSSGDVSITDCTFQNNNASYGGAVMLYGSTGDVCIIDCTFQNNIAGYGGAVLLYGSTGNVSIIGCTFQNNTASLRNGGAVLLYGSTGNVSITDCTFQNNNASFGGAMMFEGSTGNVSITGCTFQNNNAKFYGGGGAVELYLSRNVVSITDCTFQNNNAGYGGAVMLDNGSTGNVSITGCTFQNNSAKGYGGGGAVELYTSTSDVRITDCTFQNNSAGYHNGGAVELYRYIGDVSITGSTFQSNNAAGNGGAVMSLGSTGKVCITGCTFQRNSAGWYGGAVFLGLKEDGSFIIGNVIIINDCTFHMNSGMNGGAIYTETGYDMFKNLSITNNTATAGAAVYASTDIHGFVNDYILGWACYDILCFVSCTFQIQLTLQDVVIKGNHCSSGTCAGAIYFKGVKMDIFGSTTTGSHFSYNSPQGAIQGEGGMLTLHGYITFDHNAGVNGGAISLSNNAPLYFYPNCNVRFLKNLATGYGGAIYNNGYVGAESDISKITCILRISDDRADDNAAGKLCTSSALITFIDNHALQGGHAIYAKPIYACITCIDSAWHGFSEAHFNITPLHEDINDVQVLSFPDHVNYCGCSDPNLCNGTSPYLTTYPGRSVKLNITPVDNQNNLSPGVVYTQVDTDGINSQNIMLGPRQKAQWIGTVCGQIEYQIYGPENASLKMFLSIDANDSTTIISVTLLPCEPGFELMTESSTRMMKCDCSPFLTSLGVICDTSDGTVTRNKTNWIGVYNNTLPALAQTCPLDYCNSTIKKLSLARPGYLCNGGRTGIICGHCHGNLSVIFGSSKCQECSDMWLTTLVMFAVLGVFLVAALFFLNLTITQGTLYGLIFYANIIQVNTSIFFNQSILNPLQVIVSLVNLDLGLPMCFYNGMDDADKAGLQFVFPAYLLILTMVTILVCHYCLQRSLTTSSSFFLYRLSTIIGERAVGVLSTLIYLSYSKLLRTVIDILTHSTVHLPSGDMYVWFYDGNVEYLHGKHTALFVVAMATLTLFLLPYTFALTFIPIIEQYSEQNRLFNYLHKKANLIKPMNDAHYAPYKGEWRWWLGARLWLLVVMYSLNPVYSSERPSLLLTIQATMVILFTITQASIKPFGQSPQKTHQSNRRTYFYNQLYNSLDMFYFLNYTALAMSMSHILDQSSDQTQSAMVTVGVLVGLFVVMLMVTVLYHLTVAILKTCKMYDRTREKFNALFEKKLYDPNVPIELDDLTNSGVGTTTVTVNCGLREPLSED